METKAFEILDRLTFIPVIATRMRPPAEGGLTIERERERYLLRRAGYSYDSDCIMLCRMNAHGQVHSASYDMYEWNDRTFSHAHQYIEKNWDSLRSGDVIDVQFILGETQSPKKSEQEEF